MTKISNVLDIEYWNFEFICYLSIVIWCFRTWCLEFFIFKDATIFR